MPKPQKSVQPTPSTPLILPEHLKAIEQTDTKTGALMQLLEKPETSSAELILEALSAISGQIKQLADQQTELKTQLDQIQSDLQLSTGSRRH